MKFAFLLALACLPLCAQSFEGPQYYVGFGAAYDYYGRTGVSATTEIGIRLGESKAYSFSSIDLPRSRAAAATVRTGIATSLAMHGNLSLVVFGNAGVATGPTTILGSVGAGAFLAYDLGARWTKGTSHFYLTIGERILSITSQSVTPAFQIGLGVGL